MTKDDITCAAHRLNVTVNRYFEDGIVLIVQYKYFKCDNHSRELCNYKKNVQALFGLRYTYLTPLL